MDSKKKSALTAALSSNPADLAGGQGDLASQAKADTFAFPCLAENGYSNVNDLADGVEQMDLSRRRTLAGSAPTAPRLSSTMTDYELNPYSIRSGKEMLPTSLIESKLSSNFLSEAVIGSLPKGLSMTEKEFVLASTPLSPTLNLLNSLPSTIVNSRSMEGKRLRRHVLRGAVIVFITAGYSGKRFIFERAKELGVRSVVIDGPDSWSKIMQEEGVIERFIGLDMSDAESVFDRCLSAMQKVRKDFGELDGVVSFSEMAMPLVSRLAEKLGLPGNTPSAVDDARDKHATRARQAEVGLPTCRNFLIEDVSQLEAASKEVGYPAVIKPIYGAASIGVVRVDSFEDLKKAYTRVTKELASAKIVAGALEQGDAVEEDEGGDGDGAPAAATGNAGSWIRMSIMMEEYLDGPEVDVDLVFSEGQAVYGAVTDNWPTVEPYFLETGSNAPSILPAYQQRELLDLGVKTVQALGFQSGVFHVEGKYTSHGPRLIEVNCRMGGGPVRTMNQLVWGVDLVEEQLLCSAGIPCRPPVAAKPLVNVAEYSVNAMKSGILKDTEFLSKYNNESDDLNKDVLYARALAAPGSKVVGASDGLPTWICELMVTKPTVDEAIEYVKKIEEEIQKAIVIE